MSAMFDFSVREVLNKTALRRMAVLRPLKVVIENYPEGKCEELEAVNHPDDPSAGTRHIRFGRELYIERDDFMENPPKKFFRLSPGKEVRLRYAYFITCREVVKDAAGEVVELRCTLRSGDPRRQCAGRAQGAGDAALGLGGGRGAGGGAALQSSCSRSPEPNAADFAADLNPDSLEVLTDCAARAGARRRQCRRGRCSSSGRAISAATRIQRRAGWCSTARSACATPGPRCRRGRAASTRPGAGRSDSAQGMVPPPEFSRRAPYPRRRPGTPVGGSPGYRL